MIPKNQTASSLTTDNPKLAAKELPPFPKVFGKLGKLLHNQNTSLTDITELAHPDTSLTTRVLGLSNSTPLAQVHAIEPSDDAINRVGFREVFKQVEVAAASDFFSSRNNTYRINISTIWENALSCGLAR